MQCPGTGAKSVAFALVNSKGFDSDFKLVFHRVDKGVHSYEKEKTVLVNEAK